MAASDRAYSTNFNDHAGLVHTFARKGWGRMIAAHVNVEYQDVYQEMSVTFTKAVRAFDSSKGITFTAYVGRAIWNDFNRYAQKHITENMELGLSSVEENAYRDYDGKDVPLYEKSPSPGRSPEEELERKQEMLANLRALSATAKFLVAQLMRPSTELEEAFEAHRAKNVEERGRSPSSMSLRFIGLYFQIPDGRLRMAIRELKERYGVA